MNETPEDFWEWINNHMTSRELAAAPVMESASAAMEETIEAATEPEMAHAIPENVRLVLDVKILDSHSRIAVCSRSFSRNQILRTELLSRFPCSKFNDAGVSLSDESLVQFLAGCDGAIIALEDIT